jgi:hypothetical protein
MSLICKVLSGLPVLKSCWFCVIFPFFIAGFSHSLARFYQLSNGLRFACAWDRCKSFQSVASALSQAGTKKPPAVKLTAFESGLIWLLNGQ